MNNKNGLKRLASLALLVSLFGCDNTINDELNDALTHEAEFTFVNALNDSVDFYLQKRTPTAGSSGLFDNHNLIAENLQSNSASDEYEYDFQAVMNSVNVGVRIDMNNEKEHKTHLSLSDEDDIWAIAWQDNEGDYLTLLDKKENDSANTFNVRIFANGVYPVTLKGNQVMTTTRGRTSDFLTLDNCALDLAVNGHAIDLCSGDFGESYLLVADQNGKRVLLEE